MGRKIKGRKHRGVRDPEKQKQVKLLSIQDKINAPPSNPADQQIPKSLSQIISLKEKVKNGAITLKRKRKPKRKLGPITSHPYGIKQNDLGKPVPFFQQEKGESDKKFMNRVHHICKSVIDEAAFENKYDIDIKRNPETGQVENVVKRKKDELALHLKQVRKKKDLKGKKKLNGVLEGPKLTKSQKRQKKLREKKERKLELNVDEFKNYKDTVQFGEIVHEPPNLPAPKKITTEETSRPGKKDLLLKSLIDTNIKASKKQNEQKTLNKIIDKKGKRKDLPHALRRQLDTQQQEIIKAYKELKSKQRNVK